MRSIETEGAVAQRRRNDARFAPQGLRAEFGEAFVVVEFCDEALEGAPEGERVGAGVRVGEAGVKRVLRGLMPAISQARR